MSGVGLDLRSSMRASSSAWPVGVSYSCWAERAGLDGDGLVVGAGLDVGGGLRLVDGGLVVSAGLLGPVGAGLLVDAELAGAVLVAAGLEGVRLPVLRSPFCLSDCDGASPDPSYH